MNKLKSIYSSAYSSVVTILAVTVVTISAELSVSFKNWLAGFTGHHWVTKSYLSFIVFVLFYIIFSATKKSPSNRETQKALLVLQVFAILGFVTILGFYFYEFFAQ
ncbi:MAG: hypothetical protein AAB795_00240 [Patescibacteria group bacterium]